MSTDQRAPEPGRPHGGPAPIVPVRAADVLDLRGRRAIVGEPGKGWRYDLRTDRPSDDTHIPLLAELEYYRAEIERIEVLAVLVPIERVWIEQPGGDSALWPGGGDPARGLVSLEAPPIRRPRPASQPPRLTTGSSQGRPRQQDDRDQFAAQPHRSSDAPASASETVWPGDQTHPPADAPGSASETAWPGDQAGRPASRPTRPADQPQSAGQLQPADQLQIADEPPRLTGQRVVVLSRGEVLRDLRAMTEGYRDGRGNTVVNVCPERDWYAWAINGTTPAPTAYPINLVWVE